MNKTKDSWFFFVLYSVTYLILAANCSSLLAEVLQLHETWQICALTAGMLLCASLLFGLLRAFGVRFAVRRARKSYIRKKPSFFVTEILPVMLLYVLTLVTRVWLAYEMPLEVTGNESLFLDAGMQNTYYGSFFHYPAGVLWAYRWLLRGMCMIFGNDPLAVFALNTVIQLLIVLSGYLLLRLCFHKKAAICYAFLWNVLPCCYGMLPMVDAAMLDILILIVALLFTVWLCRERNGAAHRPVLRSVACILCGIFTGYLLIGNVLYLFVFIVGLLLLGMYSHRKKADFLCYGIGWFVGLLGVIVTGAVCFADRMNLSGILYGAKTYILRYCDLYLPINGVYVDISNALTEQNGWTFSMLAVLMLSGLLIFLTWKNEKEALHLFTPVYVGTILWHLLGCNRMINGEAMLVCIGILIVSAGFGMIFTMKNPLEKKEQPAGAEPEKEEAEIQSFEPAKEEKEELSAEETADSSQTPIRLIENPLPLPKKHIRKEMDYQYEVAPDKMNYDIAVEDTDDFDV